MEIRNIVRGENTGFAAPARPAGSRGSRVSGRSSVDRLELSRQWVESMEDQRVRTEAAVLSGAKDGKQSGGILDMLGGPEEDGGGILGYMETEEDKLDAMSEQLDVQMKCMKIAANIMKGKRVPPQDEQYLMEHDPNGYKLAMAMKALVKEDKEECESVLKDEDKEDGETSDTGETASASGGETASSSGDSGVE